MLVRCRVCRREFQHDRAPGRRGRNPVTCSPRCHAAWDDAQAILYRRYYNATHQPRPRRKHRRRCVVCGTEFDTINAPTVCCSQACGSTWASRDRAAAAAERRRRICETCGVEFVMRPPSGKARAGKSREGRFCSMVCAVAGRRGERRSPRDAG